MTKHSLLDVIGSARTDSQMTPDDLKRLCALASLPFPRDSVDVESVLQSLQRFLGFVDSIRRVQVPIGTEPLRSVLAHQPLVMHEDTLSDDAVCLDASMPSQKDLLQYASRIRDGYYVVPLTVKKTDDAGS